MSNLDTDPNQPPPNQPPPNQPPPSYRQQYEQQLRSGPTAMMSPEDPNLGFDPNQPPPDDQGPGGTLPPVIGGNFLGNIGAFVPPPPTEELSEEERWRRRTMQPGPGNNPQGRPEPPWPPQWRPNLRQHYVPAQGNRGPAFWGSPMRFPQEPEPWEAPGIYMGVGQQLGMFGWPRLAMLGLGLNRFVRAFMEGYQRGQAGYTREQERQMKLHRDAVDEEMRNTLEEYQRVFREYGDPANWENISPENQEKLKQAIYAIASAKNDQHMLNALHNNGIAGVVDQLNYLDGKHTDLRAAKRAQEKDDEIRDNEDAILHQGGTHGTGSGRVEQPDVGGPAGTKPDIPESTDNPLEAKPGEEAPLPDLNAPPPVAPAAPAAPAAPQSQAAPTQQQAQAAPQQPPQAQQPQAPAQLAQRGDVMSDAPQPGVGDIPEQVAQAQVPIPSEQQQQKPIVSPALDDMQKKFPGANEQSRRDVNGYAEESLIQGKYMGPNEKKNPHVAAYVYRRWREMAGELNKVLTAPSPRNEQEKKAWLDHLNDISPRIAGAVEGYSKGTMSPSYRGTARGVQEWLRPLTGKYDQTIGDDNFYVRKSTKISFGSGKDGQALTATGTAYLHLKQYHDDLTQFSKLPYEKQRLLVLLGTSGWLSPEFKEKWLGVTGEDVALAARLNNDESFVSNEVERAITGGVPRVGPRKEMEQKAGWTQDVRAALAVTEDSRRKLEARIQSQQLRFDAYVGPNAGKMGDLFEQYTKMGTPAGEEPATPESNDIVRKAIQNKGRLPEFTTSAPAAPAAPAAAPAPRAPAAPRSALPDADRARAWAHEHPNDPMARQILERLGE